MLSRLKQWSTRKFIKYGASKISVRKASQRLTVTSLRQSEQNRKSSAGKHRAANVSKSTASANRDRTQSASPSQLLRYKFLRGPTP